MKQQTGWAKCPICEGSGEVETDSSKGIRAWDAYNNTIPGSKTTCHFAEYEPCPTCKDQEFKGCLPVYGEKLILNTCKSCNDLFESVDKSDPCEHCNGEWYY